MYHKNRYPKVEELAKLADIHRSTLEKYIALLLTIQDYPPYTTNNYPKGY